METFSIGFFFQFISMFLVQIYGDFHMIILLEGFVFVFHPFNDRTFFQHFYEAKGILPSTREKIGNF